MCETVWTMADETALKLSSGSVFTVLAASGVPQGHEVLLVRGA